MARNLHRGQASRDQDEPDRPMIVDQVKQQHTVLQEADIIINGDRQGTYGGPEESFTTIAGYWINYLESRFGGTINLLPEDVAYMMILLKVARTRHGKYHRDTVVDIAGYAGTVELIQEGK